MGRGGTHLLDGWLQKSGEEWGRQWFAPTQIRQDPEELFDRLSGCRTGGRDSASISERTRRSLMRRYTALWGSLNDRKRGASRQQQSSEHQRTEPAPAIIEPEELLNAPSHTRTRRISENTLHPYMHTMVEAVNSRSGHAFEAHIKV